MIRLFLKSGADMNATDNDGTTPFFLLQLDYESTRALLEGGANVESKDENGWTMLHKAAAKSCECTV